MNFQYNNTTRFLVQKAEPAFSETRKKRQIKREISNVYFFADFSLSSLLYSAALGMNLLL